MWNFGGVYQEKTLTFARKLCHKNSHGTLSNPDLSKKGKILCTNSILMILFGQLTSFHFWLRNKETSFNKKTLLQKLECWVLVGWLVSEKPHLLWRGKKSVRGITWARYFSISTSALGRCTWAPATSTWPVSWLLSPLGWTEGSMKGEGVRLRKVVKEWWNNLELPNQLNYIELSNINIQQ